MISVNYICQVNKIYKDSNALARRQMDILFWVITIQYLVINFRGRGFSAHEIWMHLIVRPVVGLNKDYRDTIRRTYFISPTNLVAAVFIENVVYNQQGSVYALHITYKIIIQSCYKYNRCNIWYVVVQIPNCKTWWQLKMAVLLFYYKP